MTNEKARFSHSNCETKVLTIFLVTSPIVINDRGLLAVETDFFRSKVCKFEYEKKIDGAIPFVRVFSLHFDVKLNFKTLHIKSSLFQVQEASNGFKSLLAEPVESFWTQWARHL